MTQQYWPVLEQAMNNAQWGQLITELGTPGVAGPVNGTALLPYRTPAGLFVPAGSALSTLGAFYQNTSDVQITVPPNATGAVRYDLLVLRHSLTVAPEPRLTYVVGNGTAAPAHTPATDIPLGMCLVQSASSVPLTVTDARTFTSAPVVPCRSALDIPAASRRPGLVAFEYQSGRARIWTGAEFRNFAYTTDAVPLMRRHVSGSAAGIVDSVIIGADTPIVNYRALVRVDARVRLNLSGGTADYWAILRRAAPGQVGVPAATKVDLDVCEVKTNGGTAYVSAYVLLEDPGDQYGIGVWITRVGGAGTVSVTADPKLNRMDFHVTAYPGD